MMKTKLITGLRTAANAIEQGTFCYEWSRANSCNCGSLFCALTGKSVVELSREIPKPINDMPITWTNLVGQYCPITGLPTHKLFRELMGYGLTQSDMVNLEYLSDKRIVERMGLFENNRVHVMDPKETWSPWSLFFKTRAKERPTRVRVETNYKNKNHVIAYMRAWADILTEEGVMDVATPESELVNA